MRACPECGEKYDDAASFCTADGARLTSEGDARPDAGLPYGQVLGSYRALELLGEGGMGRVFSAEHVRLGRKVALKILRPELSDDPQAVKRFFAEARAVNRVAHENVVEITDFFEGEKPGDPRYYIMELLEGESLRALLQREPVLPLERSLDICAQLASALAAVHGAGIVHRDLKPDNVFLTTRAGRGDFVKLLDFGIAKQLQRSDGESVVRTAHGAVMGTPEYMAPEQAAGAAGVDRRADVYALGVILYEMVTGRPPVQGNTFGETLVRQMTWSPPPPSALRQLPPSAPPQLEALIMRCLDKHADNRPQRMKEVEAALLSCRGHVLDNGGSVAYAAEASRQVAAEQVDAMSAPTMQSKPAEAALVTPPPAGAPTPAMRAWQEAPAQDAPPVHEATTRREAAQASPAPTSSPTPAPSPARAGRGTGTLVAVAVAIVLLLVVGGGAAAVLLPRLLGSSRAELAPTSMPEAAPSAAMPADGDERENPQAEAESPRDEADLLAADGGAGELAASEGGSGGADGLVASEDGSDGADGLMASEGGSGGADGRAAADGGADGAAEAAGGQIGSQAPARATKPAVVKPSRPSAAPPPRPSVRPARQPPAPAKTRPPAPAGKRPPAPKDSRRPPAPAR